MIFKKKDSEIVWISVAVVGVLFVLCMLFFKEKDTSAPPQPIISVSDDTGMVEFKLKGANIDNISLMSPDKLYMANIRFIESLAQETTEMSAMYDKTNDMMKVSIVVDRGTGGTVQGPVIIFEMDCSDFTILNPTCIEYEGQTVLMEEFEMRSLGKLSLQLIEIGYRVKTIQELL